MPHEDDYMFEIGREYTRDEIHAQVGGSKQSYLPIKNGAVVAACLKPQVNPRAPQVILCGRGERIAPAGHLLASQQHAIPVFLKRGTSRWEYLGLFKAASSHTSGAQFEALIEGSGRLANTISLVVVMDQTPTGF